MHSASRNPAAVPCIVGVGIEQAAIQQPAPVIVLNLPEREPVAVSLLHREARAGYIPWPGVDYGMIPAPEALLSTFSWRWYGKSEQGYTVQRRT